MGQIEELVKASQWDEVIAILQERWQNDEPASDDLFYMSLAHFTKEDLFAAYRYGLQAFELNGDSAVIARYMASLCVLCGKVKESYFYRKMLSAEVVKDDDGQIVPDGLIPDYTNLLGQVEEAPLLRKGVRAEVHESWEAAEHWYQQFIAFEPNEKSGYLSLVRCQISQERFRAALDTLKSSRAVFPEDDVFASLTGDMLIKLGQFSNADACYKWAVDQAPFDEKVHVRRIRGLVNNPYYSFEECLDTLKKWSVNHLQEMKGALMPPELGERAFLRVGFILQSVDWGRVAPAIREIFSHRDMSQFQFIGYGDGDLMLGANRHYKTAFDEWRDVAHADAMTIRNMVIADRVDILIDMSGLHASEVMRCFGSRLAPLQVLWSDYNLSAVLPEVDYVVSDRCQDGLKAKHVKPECSSVFSYCREILEEGLQRDDERMTFVADASFQDLDANTISLWSKVLLQHPDSVLVLRSHDFFAEDNTKALIDLFGIYGMAHRVDVVQEADRRVFFVQGDAVLLPSRGAKAEVVLDALSAGKPVFVSEEHHIHLSKGRDILYALDLGDRFACKTDVELLSRIKEWANDKETVDKNTADIFEKLKTAAFFDAEKRMKQISVFLKDLWVRQLVGKA